MTLEHLLLTNLLLSRLAGSRSHNVSSIEPTYPQGYPQANRLIYSVFGHFDPLTALLPKSYSRLVDNTLSSANLL